LPLILTTPIVAINKRPTAYVQRKTETTGRGGLTFVRSCYYQVVTTKLLLPNVTTKLLLPNVTTKLLLSSCYYQVVTTKLLLPNVTTKLLLPSCYYQMLLPSCYYQVVTTKSLPMLITLSRVNHRAVCNLRHNFVSGSTRRSKDADLEKCASHCNSRQINEIKSFKNKTKIQNSPGLHRMRYKTATTCYFNIENLHNSLPLIRLVGRRAQSVYRLSTGWTVRGSKPGGGEIFRTCPDRPWGPPSLLYNGYRVFSGGKERPGRDADPSPPSSVVVKKE